MEISAPLYENPALYERLFPLDEEEIAFWRDLLLPRNQEAKSQSISGILLDVGAGPSGLGRAIGAQRVIALDPCAAMLKHSPLDQRVQGDGRALPLRAGSAAAVFSRLFGLAYAAADTPAARLPELASEIRRILTPGGAAALEIPLAARPRRLQGLEETAEISPGLEYRFQYLELLTEHELGAVLETVIRVTSEERSWQLETPLFVFTPQGARNWAKAAGLERIRFLASYDLTTETDSPPDDALRGVLAGIRVLPN